MALPAANTSGSEPHRAGMVFPLYSGGTVTGTAVFAFGDFSKSPNMAWLGLGMNKINIPTAHNAKTNALLDDQDKRKPRETLEAFPLSILLTSFWNF